MLTPEQENEEHNKPCPYRPSVMCVQYPDFESANGDIWAITNIPTRDFNIDVARAVYNTAVDIQLIGQS